MNVADISALLAAAAAIGGLGWFFFGPRRARSAQLEGRVQRAVVTVKGGYSPDVITARQGVPLEMVFDRQESGDCTSRVVFPDLAVSAPLPAFGRTTVRLDPARAGSFGFACGMNMIHGTLVVEPSGGPTAPDGHAPPAQAAAAEPPAGQGAPPAASTTTAADAETAQAAERRAEIADLTRRVIVGAVLTAPVLFAVMASDVFKAGWVPGVLLNHWVQLALITPVMFYTGWPIHRTGWLALSHRSADMNSLITLGTTAAYGYSLLVTVVPGLVPAEMRGVYLRDHRCDLDADPAGPAGRDPRQGGYRAGHPRAARAAGPHRPGGPRRHRDRDPGRGRGGRGCGGDPAGGEDPGRRGRGVRFVGGG